MNVCLHLLTACVTLAELKSGTGRSLSQPACVRPVLKITVLPSDAHAASLLPFVNLVCQRELYPPGVKPIESIWGKERGETCELIGPAFSLSSASRQSKLFTAFFF